MIEVVEEDEEEEEEMSKNMIKMNNRKRRRLQLRPQASPVSKKAKRNWLLLFHLFQNLLRRNLIMMSLKESLRIQGISCIRCILC